MDFDHTKERMPQYCLGREGEGMIPALLSALLPPMLKQIPQEAS